MFVGGCTTGLLISDEAAADVRTTIDVDAIVDVLNYAEYISFSEKLQMLGFATDTSEGAPLCRWQNGEIKFDLMPLDEKILGFSNHWYKPAMETANDHLIEAGLLVRVVSAPYFCATKLEAFKGRGKGDFLTSHDLEDFIMIVDGRPELLEELQASPDDLRSYVAGTTSQFLKFDRFIDALPGHLLPDEANQSRMGVLMKRLEQISKL